jgi:cytochrome c peroxidase
MTPATASSRGSFWRRFRWSALVLLLLVNGAGAQTLSSTPSSPVQSSALPLDLAHSPESITPIPAPPAADPRKLALGERLFQDPGLSRNRSRSCLSCHDTRHNGADANRHDKAIGGTELFFNTNTVFNAALNFRLDWEGDIKTLESQAAASLESPRTMDISIDEALARLRTNPEMVARFEEAYGHEPDRASLLDAIATYERSLLTPGSRFDRWLEGEETALSAEEQRGYELFESFGCISCHQGVNVGGNLYERHGIFAPLAAPKPEILRVPSLRNVAVTPPYFHDGSAATLEDAVRRMAAAQLDRTLSDQQTGAIVAFLRTLTGTYRGRPVTEAVP